MAGTRQNTMVVIATMPTARPSARRSTLASSSRGMLTGVSATSAGSATIEASDAKRRAGNGQHQAFGEELRDQLTRRRAHRQTHRDFALARQRAGQQQRRDVETADQQHETDRADEHQQRRAVVAKLLVEQRNRVAGPSVRCSAETRLASRTRSVSTARRRLLERRALLQPHDRFHEVREPGVPRQVPLQPLPHIHVVRVVEARRHDAGDGVAAGR